MRWTFGCAMLLGCAADPACEGSGCEPEPPPAEGELDGVQVGGAGDTSEPCGVAVVTEVGLADLVLGGHSANEALALVGAELVHQPVWFDGRTATVTVTAVATGDTVTVNEYPEDLPTCPDTIDFPAVFSLMSSDGALAEQWAFDIQYQAPWTTIGSSAVLQVDTLEGTFDPDALLPGAERLSIGLEFQADGSSGSVGLEVTAIDPTGTAEPGYAVGEVLHWADRL